MCEFCDNMKLDELEELEVLGFDPEQPYPVSVYRPEDRLRHMLEVRLWDWHLTRLDLARNDILWERLQLDCVNAYEKTGLRLE